MAGSKFLRIESRVHFAMTASIMVTDLSEPTANAIGQGLWGF